MGFEVASYDRHAEHFSNDLLDPERIRISNSWFDETTADYWRHARAYECADCISDQETSWLTIGDGRWGLDAIRLRKKGFAKVLPTDISEPLLKAARGRGLISDYAVENAERLSFSDRSFDYVFCKESFHHFPRPYAALYEMLRVARKAVFLIEPNDSISAAGIARNLARELAKRVLRKPKQAKISLSSPPSWESIGNYVYALSRREAEKVALGLNLSHLAIKGLNDHYIEGCEFEVADASRSQMFRKMVSSIEFRDRMCRLGLHDYDLLMFGFFLQPIAATDREQFSKRGWNVSDLPRNPYITDR